VISPCFLIAVLQLWGWDPYEGKKNDFVTAVIEERQFGLEIALETKLRFFAKLKVIINVLC